MPDNRRELIKYRLESARERLNSAEVLLASKSYKDSIGRSYYAMFTAVRALLAKDGVDYSKHLWYRQLPSQTAQETRKQLDKAWRSFLILKI